jgi:hypothetical protein
MWPKVRYLLLLLALCAMATCPAARRHWLTRERAREAPLLLGVLGDRVEAVWKERGRFPQEPAGPTPPLGACCSQGGECAVDLDAWRSPGWAAFAFTIDDPHRYSYQYQLVDGGKAVVIRAIGDLDCNGTAGTYEVRLEPDGTRLKRTATSVMPLE